jgi:alpha-L-fucosidase
LSKLQEDFLGLKFGMFVHFNMLTYIDRERIEGYPDPAFFCPGVEMVDTDAWADAAVSAGMAYGVLTAKHSSGFCLWDTKYTTYSVMHDDCPYKQDLVEQFVTSFKSRGLKVGLYYGWRHPEDKRGLNSVPPECDPATHSWQEQIAFQKAQVAELIERYPDVFYIWNDALDDEVIPAGELLSHIKSVRLGVLASSNWWSWAKKGTPYLDIAVKELRDFPESNQAPGETCWQLEDGFWFWGQGSCSGGAQEHVDRLALANSRNSNYLLNVGPDRNGRIIESSIQTLGEIGKLWKQDERA